MKISEMIKNLEEFKAAYGDIDCWYARDDEGNGYQAVYFEPSFRYVSKYGEMYANEIEVDECGVSIEDVTPVCIIN